MYETVSLLCSDIGDALIVFGEYDGIFGTEGDNETISVCFNVWVYPRKYPRWRTLPVSAVWLWSERRSSQRQHYSTQTVFRLTNSLIPASESSRPYPDCLMPPNGILGSDFTS